MIVIGLFRLFSGISNSEALFKAEIHLFYIFDYNQADHTIAALLHHSMASDSSSGFSHLRPGVFHISLHIRQEQPRE